jgi:predicted peptidase
MRAIFRSTLALLCTVTLLNVQAAESDSSNSGTPGKQIELELKTDNGRSIPYLLYLPKDYGSRETNWPVMLFLHGRGESFGPLSIVKKWGPPRIAERGENFGYVLVSPQCPQKESWAQPAQQELILKLLNHVLENYKVDKDRVYLTGLSMGGYGSWRLAADHPELFAAVVPICGAGKTSDADKLKELPIWVFHGTADPTVPFKRSEEMVDAIKAAGGTKIRFTTLEYIGHNSWESAYAAPELYEWLNHQSRHSNDANHSNH